MVDHGLFVVSTFWLQHICATGLGLNHELILCRFTHLAPSVGENPRMRKVRQLHTQPSYPASFIPSQLHSQPEVAALCDSHTKRQYMCVRDSLCMEEQHTCDYNTGILPESQDTGPRYHMRFFRSTFRSSTACLASLQ